MKIKAEFTIKIINRNTGKVASIEEDTLDYIEGVIGDAIERDPRIYRTIEDTYLGKHWEIYSALKGSRF